MDSELPCVCPWTAVCLHAHAPTCTSDDWISVAASPHGFRPPSPVPGPPSRFVQIPTHICESPGLQIKGEHG